MYTQFSGFSEEPFQDTPDPRFLFLTETHKKALNAAICGINEKKGFLFISGEPGTGKTILIQHLLNSLDKRIKTVLVWHPRISFEDMLKKILLELGRSIADQNKVSLKQQFNDYLTQGLARDENLVIFIEEAHDLRKEVMEELQACLNLQGGNSHTPQIVFIGQPEFENKLNSEKLKPLKQTIRIRCQLQPLTEEEAVKYVEHRLNVVGSSCPKVFTPKAISLICRQAGGIPRTLNLICDNALRYGGQLSEKKIDVPIVKKALDKMYPQESKISHFPAFREKMSARRIPYSLLALLCLALVIFLGREYLKSTPEKEGTLPPIKPPVVTAKAVTPAPEIKTDLSPKDAPSPVFHQEVTAPKTSPPVSVTPSPLPQLKIKSPSYKTVKVEERDTLSSLCLKYYNFSSPTLMDHIVDFNPQIVNPHLILAHDKIKIPEITESSLIIESSDGIFKVYLGTFSKLEHARPYKDESVLQGKRIDFIPWEISPQETWYRAVAGKFDTREEALKVIHDLKQKGILPSFRGSLKK